MAKRKRESQGPSTIPDSGAKSSEEIPAEPIAATTSKEKKRRRKLSSAKSLDPADICAELYDIIRNYRADDGRVLCEPFIRVPKRRNIPEYYDVVSTPIDLLKIQQRLKTDEYEDLAMFTEDVQLLLDNAIKFYKPDSQEYKDAQELKEVFEESKENLCSGGNDEESDDAMEEDNTRESEEDKSKPGKPGRPPKDTSKQTKKSPPTGDEDDSESTSTEGDLSSSANAQFYEDMVGAVLEQQDSHGRIICELFKRLPPMDLYPEYYAVIKEPIDLKIICTRIRSAYYSSVEDLERDLQTMVKNAHTFNEPGSQVYKDASAIKKTIQTKKAEIEHTLMGAKSSSRLKARRSSGRVSSAVTALLEEEDDQVMYQTSASAQEDQQYGVEEGGQGDDEMGGDDDADNPLMILFDEIYRHTDPMGRPMVEPFLRLPSRRAYPDYYEVIKKPIALMKIRSQIKVGYYDSMETLESDLLLCFDNARTYNEPNSMLYKDAGRMVEHMRKKKAEILKMIADKGISLEDCLKKRRKFKRTPDGGESQSSDDGAAEQVAAVTEIKQMKEMKKKKKVSADGKPKKRKGEEVDPMVLKKRMRQLFKAVTHYQDESGRYLSAIFMDLPSSEEYPDYYKVISEPVCLSQMEANIRDNKYATEEELLLDFEVMFDNARYYNEEESQVYQDACVLEKVLKKRRKALGPIHPVLPGEAPSGSGHQHTPGKMPTPTKSGRMSSPGAARKYYHVPSARSELKELCKELFTAVKDCTDFTGRQLCIIFQKLPSRAEYPDYYTLIKKPIDMAKIQSKLNGDQYQNLDDFMSDLHLMFDNACRYNEPDSQVYKDALTLLRALLRKKAELVGDENRIPNVSFLVQKLLVSLYTAVMQHVDEEGRCFSDSLAELTIKHVDSSGERKINLESIGESLKRYQYRRLDKFQEDMFAIFEKARKISHSDCEMYDDAIELQVYFTVQRDKLCKDGERFISPALLVTRRHLIQELDEERKKKAEKETQEEDKQKEQENKDGSASDMAGSSGESGVEELTINGSTYILGDFVYVEPRESNLQTHVVLIEKLWVDTSGEKWLYGNWYYRPEETFHLATRKFLEKEVFKSDYNAPAKLSKVQGKCHVMFVKDYFKQKPEEFEDIDVFVCESRYSNRNKAFKKIKLWPVQRSNVTLVSRENPLTPKRVPSVFAPNKLEQTEAMDTDDGEDSEADTRKNVVLENCSNPEEGCTYFEQMCIRDVPYKLGDSVYLKSDEDYLYIARIDRMWSDRGGNTWIHGPWFIGPGETQHLPTKMFHEQEVFLSSLEETSPGACITGKCMVLPLRDYVRCRPTEVPEKDIYLNEARYDEEEGQFRRLKGLKRYSLSITCNEEEFYYFEEPITPLKVPSPLLFEDQDMMAASETSPSPATSVDSVESGKKVKKPRGQSGYLLFSHEMRGIIRRDHPEYAFGEISRLIGEEWRNASAARKSEYETKAQLQLSQLEAESSARAHASGSSSSTSMFVYDCLWRGCDFQYEDLQDLRVHVLDSTQHLHKAEDGFYHCFWTTCTRARRGARPYNSSAKLFRHCREVHLAGPPRVVAPQDRSKNFFPRHQAAFAETGPEPSPPPVRPTTAPSTSPAASLGPSSGNIAQAMLGMAQGTAQGMGGHFQQQNAASGPNQYGMSGRLTPQQAMQQAMFTNNSGAGAAFGQQGMQQNPAQMMQRQMPVMGGGMGMSPQAMVQQQQQPSPMPGQSPGYQQPYNQPQQFNFQQPMNPLQQMSQMGQINTPQQVPQPTNQMPPQQINQYNQMNQYQTPIQHQQQIPPQVPAQQAPPQPPMQMPVQAEVPAPVFIAPPSKPQRLHHSEAYLRYIEGLRDGSPHMSNWTQSRKPDPSTMTPQQLAQLPVHWLGNGHHDNPVDALWALKEHMMRDALSLSRTGES